MTLDASVPVRFPADVRVRLDAVSKKTDVGLSQLVRLAVERYLDEIDRTGQITIPVSNPSPGSAVDDSVSTPPKIKTAIAEGGKKLKERIHRQGKQ